MGDEHQSRGRGAWLWVAAVGVPVMVTCSWIALWEWDHCGKGDTGFAWLVLIVIQAGLLAGGVNLVAALGTGKVTRFVITIASCALVVLDYVLLGLLWVGEAGFNGPGDGDAGFSDRSGAVLLACLVVSLIPVVMMWLSARPPSGAGPRWWESAPVRAIAVGILVAGVPLTAAYWVWASEACSKLWAGPDTTWTRATVVRWVDGDTVVTSEGTIRLIGVDAPEKGACGSAKATMLAKNTAPAASVVRLGKPSSVDDEDSDDRKLRYVVTKPSKVDIAAELIRNGSKARYDSEDGSDWHPRQAKYRRLDRNNANYRCRSTATRSRGEVPGAHTANVTHSEPVNAAIREFLAGLPA